MPDFIIEILSEEIPARMQAQAANNFKKLVLSELAGQKLQFSSVRSYVTPRRLAVLVTGVPKKQPTNNEENTIKIIDLNDHIIQDSKMVPYDKDFKELMHKINN